MPTAPDGAAGVLESRPSRTGVGRGVEHRGVVDRGDHRLAVSVAVEKAVVPPFVAVVAKVPSVPVVRSQARKVMAAAMVPLKLALGWK